MEKFDEQKKVMQANQILIEGVGKAVVSCLVVGGVCGFVFIAKAALRQGSIILNFSILYPSHQVQEQSLVKALDSYFYWGKTVKKGMFEAELRLCGESIKGNTKS